MGRHGIDLSYAIEPLDALTERDFRVDVGARDPRMFANEDLNETDLIRLRYPERLGSGQPMNSPRKKAVQDLEEVKRALEPISQSFRRDSRDTDETSSSEVTGSIACELNRSRFDPRVIQVHAGDHQGYFEDIAKKMGTKGNPLSEAVQPFIDKASHPLLKETELQEKAYILFNALHKWIWTDHRSQEGPYRPVFISLGEKAVINEPEGVSTFDNGQLIHPSDKVGLTFKPDWILDLLRSKPIADLGYDWCLSAGHGETKLRASRDITLKLFHQIQRSQVSEIKNHPITGELLSFSLCGFILRIVYIDPLRFGTSRGYDLSEPEDWVEIIKIVALFSGPVSSYFKYWRPTVQETLKIKTLCGHELRVTFDTVQILDKRYDPYGRRSTVWSCEVKDVKQFDGYGEETEVDPRFKPDSSEVYVIKASWLLPQFADHEQAVYEHIEKGDQREHERNEFQRDPEVAIPVFIGTVIDSDLAKKTLGPTSLKEWRTMSHTITHEDPESSLEHARLTVFATKCFKAGTIIGTTLPLASLITVYRKLFKTLKYLARRGIYYRDINLGSVLRDILTGTTSLLVDFDFARIGMTRRGDSALKESQPWETSMDDCVSGNLMFMSTFVQQGRQKNAEYRVQQQAVQAVRQNIKKRESTSVKTPKQKEPEADLTRQEQLLQNLKDEMQSTAHRYIDDCESAMYTLLWLVADSQHRKTGVDVPERLRNLDELGIKVAVWKSGLSSLVDEIDANDIWGTMMEDMNKVIRESQDQLRSQKIVDSSLHEIETECFDTCDRIMREAIHQLESEEGSIPEVDMCETQPKDAHNHERNDDPTNGDDEVRQSRQHSRLRPRKAVVYKE